MAGSKCVICGRWLALCSCIRPFPVSRRRRGLETKTCSDCGRTRLGRTVVFQGRRLHWCVECYVTRVERCEVARREVLRLCDEASDAIRAEMQRRGVRV